jgi:hypothetical protein
MALPAFPGVSGGTTRIFPGQYPLQRSHDAATIITQFQNGSEARFQDRSIRPSFVLQYTAIPLSDRQNIDAFVASMLGSTGKWTFTLNGITYGACQFDQDAFAWQENLQYPLHYNGSIKCRVTTQEALSDAIPNVSNAPGPFPTFAGGMRTGYPFTQTSSYEVMRVDLPTGNRIVVPLYGSGLPGYPTRALYSWSLTFNTISDADLATLENHYIQASGRYALFSFIDPKDGAYYPTVRYDMDALKITHLKPGLNQVTVKLAECFTSGWNGPNRLTIFSTGVVTPGVLAPLGTVDGHYTQTGPSYEPAAYVTTDFPWNYIPNNALSQWIGPWNGTNYYAAGTYTYTTTFDLGPLDPATAVISGRWAADKFGAMYLNGNLISQTIGFPVSKMESFTASSGFVPGINTLTFIVQNTSGSTGLRCEVSGIAYNY